MDKLTAIKIKYDDGTYSDEIPVSVLAENVEWDSTHTLVDVLGSIDVDVTGTIQDQISQLFNEKVSNSDMQTYISSSMPAYITSWLNTNVNPVGSAVVVDSSLSISGAAADAKKTGDEITQIKSDLNTYTEHNVLPSIEFSAHLAWQSAVGDEVYTTTNTNRCANPTLVLLTKGVYLLQVASGYRMSYRQVDDSNVCTYDSGWITNDTLIVADGVSKYAFSGGKNDDAYTIPAEIHENVSLLKSTAVQDKLDEQIETKLDSRDSLCIVQLAGGTWVELNTSLRTLTFPADFSIIENSASITRYNFQTENVVSFPTSTNSYKVVFNKSTLTFSAFSYSSVLPSTAIIVAVCHLASDGAMSINCRYKINGKRYSINTENKHVLCAIVPPQEQPYIQFDSYSTGVYMTIPNDCSVFSPNNDQIRYVTTTEHVVNLKNSTTTLQKVYFNPANGTFSAVHYSNAIPDGCLLIAAVRTVPVAVSISAPYSIDGNLYGILTADKTAQISSLANVKAVNHRGFNSTAPENTLPAFRLSRKNGFKYVETDVRFTSDGVPVLLHDETINRTGRNADGTTIANDIRISDITYAQAQEYDFGIWKANTYAGTKIPTLSEFMSVCRDIGLTPRVELNVLTVANAQTMFDIINSYGMAKKVEYNCNNMSVAQKFLELVPSATIVYGMSSYDANTVDAVGALKTNINTIIINMYYSYVTAELIQKCKDYGIELEVWTVNNVSTILNLDPYISGVTSDSINASLELYNRSIS